jgi:purine-binding chemotaxis protein CheW
VDTSVVQDDMTVLLFELDGHRYALVAAEVREITRAALPTRLAQAPSLVEGLINVRGQVAVVLDMRARFQLPVRPIQPSDMFLVCHVKQRLVALRVDNVLTLCSIPRQQLVLAAEASSSTLHVRGVFALPDGLLFLGDLATFLSDAESESLARAEAMANALNQWPS